MPNELSHETQSQLDTLCKQISLSHHLDPEIQLELRTHLEDKLHAYLAGQIPLSEPDALLLATSHFGNPAHIQSLFHAVHPTARPLSLFRKCASAIIATLAASLLVSLFQSAWRLFVLYPVSTAYPPENYAALQRWPFPAGDHYSSTVQSLIILGKTIEWLLQIGVLAVLLRSFRRQHSQGARPWFQKQNPLLLTLIVAAAFILNLFLSQWITMRTWNAAPAYSAGPLVDYRFTFASTLFYFCTLAAEALLWLSYFNPKTWSARLTTTLCWLLYFLAIPLIQSLVWMILLVLFYQAKLKDTPLTLLTSALTLLLNALPRLLLIAAAALTTHHFLSKRRNQIQSTAT